MMARLIDFALVLLQLMMSKVEEVLKKVLQISIKVELFSLFY